MLTFWKTEFNSSSSKDSSFDARELTGHNHGLDALGATSIRTALLGAIAVVIRTALVFARTRAEGNEVRTLP